MAKSKKNVVERGPVGMPNSKRVEVEIPDEAIEFIVSRYLSRHTTAGVPLVVGISTDDVETVLALFIEWAAYKNYVKDGVLFIGGSPIG